MALKELSLQERLNLSPEEKRRRYREAVKPFVEQNFTNVKYDNEGNFVSGSYVGKNDSPTAGLTKQNIADKTAPYSQNNGSLANTSMPEVTTRQLKTANDYWGQIYTIMADDPVRGNQLAEQAKYFSTQYGNPLYNPYQTATVSPELKQLFGVESFSAEWVAENYNLLSNLERNASGSPKAPTKDSTDEQKLAYYYSQILDAENNTLKAEQEVSALKQQISEKVAAAKLNGIEMTVDEIYKSLDMKDYTALKAMEDKKLTSQPYELTRAVNYSEDTVYGMIQAALDSESSDITGIDDFQVYGAKYSNVKYEAEETEKRIAKTNAERAKNIKNKRIQEDNGQMPGMEPEESEEFVPIQTRPGKEHQTEAKNQAETEDKPKVENKSPAQIPIGINRGGLVQKTEQPEDPKIDVADLESKLTAVNTKLEAVDSDEHAMPFEQYEQLESEKEQLESQLRAYKNAHLEEYVAEKYAQYRNDPKFNDKVTQGSQMENKSDGHEQYSDTYADPRSKHSALTQDEKDMYNYLLATQGTDAANQYIADLQTAVNARQGKKVAEVAKESSVEAQLLYNLASGAVNSLEGFASAFSAGVRAVGADEYARAEMSQNNNAVVNIMNDLAYSIGNMAPSILLSSVTGGAGAVVGAGFMGVSSAGNAYQQIMQSGAYSPAQAKLYSTFVGASEATLGYLLGGISKLGNNQALAKLGEKIAKIDNVFLRAAAKMGGSMVSEGVEEWLQANLEPVLQNWLLGMDNDINLFSEEAMYSALMGALTAGMLESAGSGMSAATEIRNERSIGKALTESGHTTQLVELAKNSKNADVRETAQALEAGTMRWTEGNLGRLAIEYRDSGGDTSFLNQPVESDIQPAVSAVTTDKDAAMALNRAIRGQATEGDLELLEKGAYIPEHEDSVKTIKDAAKNFRAISKKLEAKETQVAQLKDDMDTARSKVDSAKDALAQHLRGVNRIQQGETLPKALMVKHTIEQQIEQVYYQYSKVSEAGLEPKAQQEQLDVLRRGLAEVESQVAELIAGNRESTAFQGQVVNAQKSLDAANRNYIVAETELESVWEDYKTEQYKFRDTVSSAVNRAYADNMLAEVARSVEKARETVEVDDIPWEQNTESSDQIAPETKSADEIGLTDEIAPPEEDMSGYDEVVDTLNQENMAEESGMAELEQELEDGARLISEDIAEELKADLRGRRINLSETQQNEIASATGGYGNFRQNMMGKITIANNGASLDSVWSELSDAYPNVFPADASEGDQVRILANVLNDLYPDTDRSGGIQYSKVNHSLNPGNTQQTSKLPKNKQPVTAQTIIRKAASALGVPIRTGIEASMKGTPKQANAYYKQQAVAARVPGDIANITHEIGHALDARHHFTRDHADMAQKLAQNLPAQYASAYDAKALPGEAVADMVYTYVVQGEQAAINYGGDAYYAFWKNLSRSEKRALRTMQAEVDQYRNQTADETGTRAVTQTKADTDLRNASTKVKDMVNSAAYNLMDNLAPAMRLDRLAAESQKNGFLSMDKHSETAFATARRAETIASAQLTQAMSDPSGNIIGDSFADCLKGIKADQMVDLSKYLAYVRALDWMDKGRKALDPAITKDEMITFCLKQRDTGVADAAEKIWAWYRKFGQAWLVDSGRMSQSEFNTLWKEEPHYVPFNRVIDHKDTNPSSFAQGIQQLNTGIHSVEGNGSQRDIFDPLTSLMQGVANITEATLRNEVGKTILWQVRNSENLEGMVTEVPASTLREDIKETAMMLDNGAEIMGQIMDKPLKKPDGTNIFGIVDEGGQISYIQVNDPQLLALMQNPNPKSTNKFLGAVAMVTRAVNATVTTLSGTFATRNLPSDANAAWRATPEKNPIRFFVDMIGSAADVIKGKNHSADYYEWAAMGGLGDDVYAHAGLTGESARQVSTQYLGTRPSSVKEWGQRVGDAVNSMATALSAISENTTRLTLYKEGKRAALRDKQSDVSARAAGASLSRMGTTDFNRSGAQTVGISTLFRFAGATINGNIQSARTLFDRSTDITSNAGKIKGAKVALGVMARAAALAALSAALMDEDEKEQFRRMDPSAKYSGLVIPWSMVSGVKGDIKIIPYAKDAVSDLMNIGAAIADGAVHGGLWDDIRGIGENIAESLMPFGSPIWAPIDQASKNETWYGGKIIPGHLENLAYGQLQYDEDTTAMARWASTTLYNLTKGERDVSPMLIDYVLEQYFGGVYDTAVGFEEFIASIANSENGWEGAGKGLLNGLNAMGSAIRDGFTRNSITTSNVSSAYYDDVQFVKGISDTIKKGIVPPDLAQGLSQDKINEAYTAANTLSKNLNALGEKISGLYDEMDEVRANQAMSIPDQEREVSEIRKEIYNLQLSGTALVDNYRMEYCGDAKSSMIPPRTDYKEAKGYEAFNQETLPKTFRDKQDGKALTRLRDFYQQDTSKTSFRPEYPPDFVDADNVLTAWDEVDSKTKAAMEKAWTDKYLTELNGNGFMTEKDYDTVKNLASQAKRKANAAAKEVYTIKYKFKEKD